MPSEIAEREATPAVAGSARRMALSGLDDNPTEFGAGGNPAGIEATDATDATDPIGRYVREAVEDRRVQMRQLGLLFGLFAAASIGLSTFMSDIGHFLGFVGLAAIFLIGGIVIWWLGRR